MITLVAGPPCAGKSTFVKAHVEPDDQVLDWDDLYVEVTGLPRYEWRQDLVEQTEAEFRRRMQGFRRGWIIRLAPRKQHRAIVRRIYHARSIVLAVPAAECVRRLETTSGRPPHVVDAMRPSIMRWWAEYEPSSSPDEYVLTDLELPV